MNEDSKIKVLMEQYDQNLKAIHEGLGIIDQKFDRMDGRFDRMDGRVDGMVDKLDATFNAVGELQVDMTFVKNELHMIRSELTEKISKTEYLKLEKRVVFLEKKYKV